MKSWRWFDVCYLLSCFNVEMPNIVTTLKYRMLLQRWNLDVVATFVISYVNQTLQCPTLFQLSYLIRSDWQRCFNVRKSTLKRMTEMSICLTLKYWLHFNAEFRRLLSQHVFNVWLPTLSQRQMNDVFSTSDCCNITSTFSKQYCFAVPTLD